MILNHALSLYKDFLQKALVSLSVHQYFIATGFIISLLLFIISSQAYCKLSDVSYITVSFFDYIKMTFMANEIKINPVILSIMAALDRIFSTTE